MRRGWRAGAAVGAAAVLVGSTALAAPAVERRWWDGRDTDAFHAYVTSYMDMWTRSDTVDHSERDRRWVIEHRQEALALGDDACDWLRTRRDAPEVDPSGATSPEVVQDAALLETEVGSSTELSAEGKYVLIGGAWGYLCPRDRAAKTSPESSGGEED